MIYLLEAVENMQVIRATYNNKIRELEVHAVGVGTDGKTLIRDYERYDEFKLFKYEKLEGITVLEKTFFIRTEYIENDSAMKIILFQV